MNLRDPVERAYSHFKEQTYHGRETLSFEAALDAEEGAAARRGRADRGRARLPQQRRTSTFRTWRRAGNLDTLPRWFSLFPREQFHITASEDFYADPGRHVNEIWRFLGLLPPRKLLSRARHNQQSAPDIRPETRQHLQDAVADHNRGLEAAARTPAALARR